jgi:molybdate transport system ATP-binding protein
LSLAARLRLRRDAWSLDAAFELAPAGIACLFGRSGAGKTTILRCLAGLERAQGEVRAAGETWQDDARGVFLPPWRRRIGLVAQDPALFPHLDVLGNLRYGWRRAPERAAPAAFDALVDRLALGPLLARRPHGLSGGERQRVAIGRALLGQPRVLLLDEPVSALDEAARAEILALLRALAATTPMLYVGHQTREVARIADRVLWLEGGCIAADGPAAEVFASLPFACSLDLDNAAGALLDGRLLRHDETHAISEIAVAGGVVRVPRMAAAAGAPVRLQVLARDVSLARAEETASSILNALSCRVVEWRAAGAGQCLVRLETEAPDGRAALLAQITTLSHARLGLRAGERVFARFKASGLQG